jgi:hypothetical protein
MGGELVWPVGHTSIQLRQDLGTTYLYRRKIVNLQFSSVLCTEGIKGTKYIGIENVLKEAQQLSQYSD